MLPFFNIIHSIIITCINLDTNFVYEYMKYRVFNETRERMTTVLYKVDTKYFENPINKGFQKVLLLSGNEKNKLIKSIT